MREFLKNLLKNDAWGGVLTIDLFDIWHFLYIFLILGVAIVLAITLRNKSQQVKTKVARAFLIGAIISYVLDYVVMAFYLNKIDIDKLPFHICTVMCIVAAFGEFNGKFKWIKKPAVVLSIVGPLMYIVYPGSALGGISAISYKVVQTFFYHGCLFTYGFLMVAFKQVKISIKECWKDLCLIGAIAVWAGFWNYMFNDGSRHYDWFFLTGSTFPFIPKFLMPFVVVVAVFGVALCVYGMYYLTRLIIKKLQSKKEVVPQENVE